MQGLAKLDLFKGLISLVLAISSTMLLPLTLWAKETASNPLAQFTANYVYNQRSALDWWKFSYGVEPQLLHWSAFISFIGAPEECQGDAAKLWREVKTYGSMLHNSGSTLENLKSQQAFIQQVIKFSSSQCQKPLKKHLAGASLALLTLGESFYEQDQAAFYSYETVFLMMFLSLVHRDQIELVDTPIHANTDHRILGYYSCSTRDIAIDLTQNPLNIGGAIAHELQHLLSDKLALVNTRLPKNAEEAKNNPVFSGESLFKIKEPYYKAYLVLDESLAAFRAAYLQKRFKKFIWNVPWTPSQLGDLTQFKENGLMERLFDAYPFAVSPVLPLMRTSESCPSFQGQSLCPKVHLEDSFGELAGDFFFGFKVNADLNTSKWRRERREFFSLIHEVYFGKKPSKEFLDELEPSHAILGWTKDSVDFEFDGVIGVRKSMLNFQLIGSPISVEMTTMSPKDFRERYQNPQDGFFYAVALSEGDAVKPIFMNYSYITSALAMIYNQTSNKMSITCESIAKSLQKKSNGLKEYLGYKIPKNKLSNNSPNPRPGGEGAHPQDHQGRPGGEGAHPMDHTLRPCAEIKDL